MITTQDFNRFTEFALPLIASGQAESIEAVLDQWKALRERAGSCQSNTEGRQHLGWEEKLMRYQESLRPGNANFDDSREAIYPVRD